MGFRFHQRVKLLPGVHLNISARGMSVSLGVPGATINLGHNRAPKLTVGLPGTGMSYQTTLVSDANPSPRVMPSSQPRWVSDPADTPASPVPPAPGYRELKTASVAALQASGAVKLRDLIANAYTERRALQRDVEKLEADAVLARKRHANFDIFLIRNIFKKTVEERRVIAEDASAEAVGARAVFGTYGLEISWTVDENITAIFREVQDAFKQAMASRKVWQVNSEKRLNDYDRFKDRTTVSKSVTIKQIHLEMARPLYLPTTPGDPWGQVPTFRQDNDNCIYVFPSFFIFEQRGAFAVIEPHQLDVMYWATKFHEADSVPSDAITAGQTWLYANKDGTRDKRFNVNKPIPIVSYGMLHLFAKRLIDDEFMFSSTEKTERLGQALKRYCEVFAESQQHSLTT